MLLKILYYAGLVYWFVVMLGKYHPEYGTASYLLAFFIILVSHYIIKAILPADIKTKIFDTES